MLETFSYCPSCGKPDPVFKDEKRYFCSYCGFEYFHNVATAAGVFIVSKGRLVSLVRSREPGKGLLSLPGGFVDPGERAEDAVRRECIEEMSYCPEGFDFLGTCPNQYIFKNMIYHTCDLYFLSRDDSLEQELLCPAEDEVAAIDLIPIERFDTARFAFDAARAIWPLFLKAFQSSP